MHNFSRTIQTLADISLGLAGAIAISGALAGCGASGEDISDDVYFINGGDIGVAEQGLTAKASTSFQWGATTSSARLACNRSSSGQVCAIPSQRSGAYYVKDLSATNQTIARNVFGAINTAVGGSTVWLEEIDVADRLLSNIVVVSGVCSGSLSSNIEGYSCLSMVHETDLTEGAGVVGSYKSHDNLSPGGPFPDTLTIDFADADAKFATSQGRLQLKRHAIGHGVLAHMGLGSRADSPVSGSYQRRSLAAEGTALIAMSSGPKCIYNSANYTANGDFSQQAVLCSD